ncbi:thioredoxin domain-containing protein [uncultured Microscilla sp.]|uniref:thioredoxin domain-containing protein n=1 Tax=uncultured Microscilla sp. TaxID=432653 RepID=UPI0026220F62|nr:thioredoxin domain-containing protein [uncultured Microscilla sp.]
MSHQNTQTPNRLAKATSPYLLQHAYNPVDWYPWGKEALQKAKDEDKPIIVSIGYSACHWCHVMERESFEDDEVAAIMNRYFICIKVDREERPDVDAIYMEAIHAMGQRGGWPLNALLTPEAKPFYALTYLPKESWVQLLQNVAEVYQTKRDKLEQSAEAYREAIAASEAKKYDLKPETIRYSREALDKMFQSVYNDVDHTRGGTNRAPKFPMPSIWQFLLHYYQITKDEEALRAVDVTLNEMAKGGIYDQVGGGFARYSVDADWFAPHFEKMLYDNGQLLSLYADAYNVTQNPLYQQVVMQTVDFVARELTSEEGGFFSALDADSEGVEGKFYVWEKTAFDEVIGAEDAAIAADYYQVTSQANWEEGNILHRNIGDLAFAKKHQMDVESLKQKVTQWNERLLTARNKRIRPGLDDKILTSWNGLMLKGLVDAYRVFDSPKLLNLALANAQFITEKLTTENYQLYHSYKNGKASINAYLEDYAAVVDAYIALYQATFDEQWLTNAKVLTDYAVANFYDKEEGLFFFTDVNAEKLIARKKELFDNVIPASNSMMAKNLYWLGLYYEQSDYQQKASQMLGQMQKIIVENPESTANWAALYTYFAQPTAEVAIVGEQAQEYRASFDKYYYPNKILAGTLQPQDSLGLLQNRGTINEQTTVYVCYNKTCQLPVNSVESAWKQMSQA